MKQGAKSGSAWLFFSGANVTDGKLRIPSMAHLTKRISY